MNQENQSTSEASAAGALEALGRVASGIFILTVRHGEQETGMLASWVMQAGFEPPMISLAVDRRRYVCDWLSAGAPLAVCIVAESEKHLLKHFGRGFKPDEKAFEGLQVERDGRGVPILRDATLGYLGCRVTRHVDSGEHRIFLAEVIDGQMTADAAPMIHIRKSGKHY